MNPAVANTLDRHRLALLARLQSAESALRACARQDGIDPMVCAHLERARAHIREADTAIHNHARARNVQELANQLAHIDQMREELRSQEVGGDHPTQSIRV